MKSAILQCVRTGALPALLCAGAMVAGCNRSGEPNREVVVYVSADEYVATEVLDAFQEHTGIAVKMVGDAEAMKTTGLVERLRAEKNNPQADVFWSSEVFMTITLAEEGIFEAHQSEAADEWPAEWTGDDRQWYGFAARARVIVYDPARLTGDAIPDDWRDLSHDRYRGRIAMADPRFGTTGGHLGAMKAYWNRHMGGGYYAAFIDGLSDNEPQVLSSGNAGVVRAVISGEADVGMTDTDDVWAAREQGHDVQLVYPRHDQPLVEGGGTLLIPNTVARIKDGPNADTAAILIDFLLSEGVERMLADSPSHNIPLRPGLSSSYPEYAVPDPLIVNFSTAAEARKSAITEAMERIDAGSERDEARSRVPERNDGAADDQGGDDEG